MIRSTLRWGCALLPALPLCAQDVGNATPALERAPFVLRTESGPVRHFTYDIRTGTVRKTEDPVQGRLLFGSGTTGTVCLDNGPPPSGLFSSTHPTVVTELVDWGVKSCGVSCRVRRFTVMYRTDNPTADFSVAFYAATQGFGVLGTPLRRFTLVGLPGGFPDPLAPGFINAVTVDLSSDPMCLPDGPIGWSFTNDDAEGVGLLGSVGTFLAPAPNPSLSILDALDVYESPPAATGEFQGTFNFGPGSNLGSLFIVIEEETGTGLASAQYELGSGINPLVFVPQGLPTLGSDWPTSVDLDAQPGATQSIVAIAADPVASAVSTVAGEVLIDLFSPLVFVETASGSHTLPIPNDPMLIDQTFHGQAVLVGGGLGLTNAIVFTVGS